MAHLTNGSMSYERRVKTGDFEHKHAAVTINYALNEGDDADELLARARTLIVQHVHQALRGKKEDLPNAGPIPMDSNSAPAVPVAVDPGLCPDPVVDPVVVVPDELNRGFIIPESFTKPDEELLPRTSLKEALASFIPIAPNLKAAKRVAKKRVVETLDDRSTPGGFYKTPLMVVETPLVIEDTVDSASTTGMTYAKIAEGRRILKHYQNDPVEIVEDAAPVVVDSHQSGDEAIPDDFTAMAPAPTDVDLSQALSRINAKLKDRPKIQALIGEFVQSGQSYTTIPAVRRTEFVTRLEALV